VYLYQQAKMSSDWVVLLGGKEGRKAFAASQYVSICYRPIFLSGYVFSTFVVEVLLCHLLCIYSFAKSSSRVVALVPMCGMYLGEAFCLSLIFVLFCFCCASLRMQYFVR